MASLAEMAKAQAPRTFELGAALTAEEAYAKLQTRAAAFEMPFELKNGIGGKNITFKKQKDTDVIISVSFKDHVVKVTPIIQENKTSVGVGSINMRVDKNSVVRKGVKGVMDLPMQRGAYTDAVTETIRKILYGEPVEDFVHPEPEVVPQASADEKPPKNWLVALLLCLFLGVPGFHRFYVGKIGTGILWLLTGGVFGIGYLVDLVMLILGKFKDKQGRVLEKQ
jgi:hypothetical protein